MLNIYYAHHRFKYGTDVESYEIILIKKFFPTSYIFNPGSDLDVKGRLEEEIMTDCLNAVKNSDIFVFSSMDGCIGEGVYTELNHAKELGKPIFYIYHHNLYTEYQVSENPYYMGNPRIRAFINIPHGKEAWDLYQKLIRKENK